jgi:hypothetical protein
MIVATNSVMIAIFIALFLPHAEPDREQLPDARNAEAALAAAFGFPAYR